jgi:hypothetical protein
MVRAKIEEDAHGPLLSAIVAYNVEMYLSQCLIRYIRP